MAGFEVLGRPFEDFEVSGSETLRVSSGAIGEESLNQVRISMGSRQVSPRHRQRQRQREASYEPWALRLRARAT